MNRLKSKSERYFDKVSEKQHVIEEPQRCYPFVIESLDYLPGKLLDIGCGEGVLLKMISERVEGCDLFGIDISHNALEVARSRLSDNSIFIQGDSENLPFDDNSFDAIICTHSFHHYPKPKETIIEMFRCLRPGGEVIIVENYRKEIPRHLRNIVYTILRHPRGDIRFYSPKEIRTIFCEVGFGEISDRLITNKSFLIKGIK